MLLRYVGEAEPAFGAPVAGEGRRNPPRRLGRLQQESRAVRAAGRRARSASQGIPGEYLTWTNNKFEVKPWLATSWKPNNALTVWTFQIRRGVKFHNGKTTDRGRRGRQLQAVPHQKTSQILSALPASMIEPSGVVKTGPYTVQFRLKAPNNAFPYLVSQTTYQAIIQPAAIAARPDTWVSSGMIGTGPFRVKSQNKQRAELVRFNNYWGGKPPLDRVVITFYTDPAPMVLALRGGQLDLVVQMSPQQAARVQEQQQVQGVHRSGLVAQHVRDAGRSRPLPRRTRASSGRAHAQPSGHHQPRPARRRLARERHTVLPGFASTDPSIKQRKQNLELAQALLEAAGKRT